MIPILRDRTNGARSSLMQQILADISRLTHHVPPASVDPEINDRPPLKTRPPSYINVSELKLHYAKLYLAEEGDVDSYIEELRQNLLAQIRAGKRIIV
jgi:hypothetical protein